MELGSPVYTTFVQLFLAYKVHSTSPYTFLSPPSCVRFLPVLRTLRSMVWICTGTYLVMVHVTLAVSPCAYIVQYVSLHSSHTLINRIRCYMASLQGTELPNPQVDWWRVHIAVIVHGNCSQSVIIIYTCICVVSHEQRFQANQACFVKGGDVLSVIPSCHRKS